MKILDIAPDQIEAESFRLIDESIAKMKNSGEIKVPDLSPEEYQIARRVIHATGDFDFLNNIRFSNNAVKSGIDAIRSGRNIIVDVNMALMGVSRTILDKFGGKVICRISEEETVNDARIHGLTRSEAAIRRSVEDNPGIIAVGNAPTALLMALELIKEGIMKPGLVVGVPVGFVNAAESKELLMETDIPYISVKGNKGGTPVAVAIVNALLRLA